MNLIEQKPDDKFKTKGRDRLESMMAIYVKNKHEIQAIYKRGQLKRFFTKEKSYIHRWDFYEKRENIGYQCSNPWVYNIIRNELIENKSNIIYNPEAKRHQGYRQNRGLVKNLEIGDLIYQTDMVKCYPQIAKRLNYIGHEAYIKLAKKYNKAKTDICIAFTTAFSEEYVVSYKDGKIIEKIDTTHYELEHALGNICWEVYGHVDHLYKKYPEIILGFVVDAVYSLQLEPVREYFDLMGIEVKTITFEWWGDGVLFSPEAGIKKMF
ncbi:MAG TPA: hypothetical protein VNY73_00975 [Bacteroidia bacterium]|jgi:hypothetical protein|nr:hypothetical protein [Bacteroidia bacterium]